MSKCVNRSFNIHVEVCGSISQGRSLLGNASQATSLYVFLSCDAEVIHVYEYNVGRVLLRLVHCESAFDTRFFNGGDRSRGSYLGLK